MNKFLVILCLIPTFSFASAPQFGRVVEVSGSGFISHEGKTHEVKKGEVLYTNSEIIVEQKGQITFTDNADHRFHLGNASTAAIYSGKVELRSGDMWFQSLNNLDDSTLVTANAKINFSGGEAIVSYDSLKGKTQLMVIDGMMKLSNLRTSELNLTVAEGNFSFVDYSFEEGMPRDPTPVGEKTYGRLISLFKGVETMDSQSSKVFKAHDTKSLTHTNPSNTSREIASVHEQDNVHQKNETKKMEDHYLEEMLSKNDKTIKHHSSNNVNNVKKKLKKTSSQTTSLVVKIYGQSGTIPSSSTAVYDLSLGKLNKVKTQRSNRMPASVSTEEDNMNNIPTSPTYKESDKLIMELNKL